ncbi:dodecin family protein [Flavobacterium luteum]|uniref:Dodecin domain-containing protein n=1 Tax=Flavobacterium luteum TaxID=2026654 RepID=A0A7J5AJM4_9FLAO|nr:dodecin family protein [Flavobacterium luteum]KAB1157598.1 dodecin domain-containing protein [Flavobacterium luteum]
MALIKIIELLVESDKSWEDAAEKAVEKASETLHNIRSIWVRNLSAQVQKGKIISWQLNCKISFEKDENN